MWRSVTRFDKILTLWRNLKCVWEYLWGFLMFGKKIEPTLAILFVLGKFLLVFMAKKWKIRLPSGHTAQWAVRVLVTHEDPQFESKQFWCQCCFEKNKIDRETVKLTNCSDIFKNALAALIGQKCLQTIKHSTALLNHRLDNLLNFGQVFKPLATINLP